MVTKENIPVLLVDSHCAICNRSVQFIRKHQGNSKILFRSLHSDEGKKYLKKYDFPENYDRSLVYLWQNKAYTRSDAALKVTRNMKLPFRLLQVFLILPRKFRDSLYDLLARHRHRLSGQG